jgi:predicted AAA+ superfamily ATPase
VLDARVTALLNAMGGIVLEGPRGSGKTTLGLRHTRSSVGLDNSSQAVELAELDPASVLRGDTPRLVDEWQLAPGLWNAARHEIDHRRAKGQFVLSNSTVPPADTRRHAAAGRFARLRVRTMSLSESGRSSDAVSLTGLAGTSALGDVRNPLTICDLAAEAVRGGWPALTGAGPQDALAHNTAYLADLCSVDLPGAAGPRHDPVRMGRLLAAISRVITAEADAQSLTDLINRDGGPAIDRATVRSYLETLEAVFAVEDLPVWASARRSSPQLRAHPKRLLADPSLACAALGLSPYRLVRDPAFFERIFEAMALRDLRVYAEAARGQVYHHRDAEGLGVDAVIEFPDRSWAAVEIELGEDSIEGAERNLLRLRDSCVDVHAMAPPAFLAVVTGAGHGRTLTSGVHTVPLGALAP